MVEIRVFTKDEIEHHLELEYRETVNLWLERGDGIAVYENVEIGHPQAGHMKFVSYGSTAAQLETEEPPVRLPDIGGDINWRYHLIGTYRGEPLEVTSPAP